MQIIRIGGGMKFETTRKRHIRIYRKRTRKICKMGMVDAFKLWHYISLFL